jgi:hypothetical protein
MSSRYCDVVIHNRHRRNNFIEEVPTTLPGPSFRQLDSHLKLGHRNGGNRYVVLVFDHLVEIGMRPLCID